MQINDWLPTQLGRDIWEKKYRFQNEDFESWLDRVSGGNDNIRQLIEEKKFLFGGRILANRGLQNQGRKVTLSNCYVISPPEDNIESIFDCAKKLARTYSYGGGCGIDVSKLSPRGSKIHNAAKETTGSVSFMDLYSLVTELIGQSGRRGALMISLDCSHPDIEEFINLKSDLNKVTKANISVRITDDFMKAVKKNENWELKYERIETNEVIFKIVNAKDLFRTLAKMNWDYAEPGNLFWDRIENWNLLSEDKTFKYAGVNPCAEEPLPEGGSCLLGSLNLSEFVAFEFGKYSKFNFVDFRVAVSNAISGLNEVLHEGLQLHPLEEQRNSVNNWRQIGLGLFGWHDTLIKLGIRYGSNESLELAEDIGFDLIDVAIETSANLTDVYNSYPNYNQEAIFNSPFFIHNTSETTKELVRAKGLANSQLLTIPPTGSTATMLGVSTALEPIYNISYTRKTESLHGKDEYYKVYTPIVEEYMKTYNLKDEKELPDFFNTAMTLNYKERIKMQGVWQKYIDASISSTVNVPNSFTIEEVEDLYMTAWENGLKGVTIFRDGCARTGILTNTENEELNESEEHDDLPWGTTMDCSEDLIGRKKKIVSGCGSIHIGAFFDPSDGKLMEVYINKGSLGGCMSNITSVSRLISVGLRTGVEFDTMIDQLMSAPVCPSFTVRSATRKDTSKGNSCSTAIAHALIEMKRDIDYELGVGEDDESEYIKVSDPNNKSPCPECGKNLKYEGGCISCGHCGFSLCS